jgi:hypothetical protein
MYVCTTFFLGPISSSRDQMIYLIKFYFFRISSILKVLIITLPTTVYLAMFKSSVDNVETQNTNTYST